MQHPLATKKHPIGCFFYFGNALCLIFQTSVTINLGFSINLYCVLFADEFFLAAITGKGKAELTHSHLFDAAIAHLDAVIAVTNKISITLLLFNL